MEQQTTEITFKVDHRHPQNIKVDGETVRVNRAFETIDRVVLGVSREDLIAALNVTEQPQVNELSAMLEWLTRGEFKLMRTRNGWQVSGGEYMTEHVIIFHGDTAEDALRKAYTEWHKRMDELIRQKENI